MAEGRNQLIELIREADKRSWFALTGSWEYPPLDDRVHELAADVIRAALERAERLEAGLDRLAEALLPWPLKDGESAFDMAVRLLERAERVEALLAEGDKLLWRYSIGEDDHTTSRRPPVVEQFRRNVRAALATTPAPPVRKEGDCG